MSIYQHFRPEEKELIDLFLGWREQVKDFYAPKLTDFLDPREIYILNTIIGHDDEIRVYTFGGNETAERKRALLCPSYFSPADDDFHISLFEIAYPKKFVAIEHRQVLGSLMSLGLKREKFGDVLIDGEHVQFLAAEEIESYLTANLEKIGRSSISLKKISFDDIIEVKDSWEEMSLTVSSLRLDALLSSLTKLSRQKAQTLIDQNKVKVNWKPADQSSFELKEGDVISARGFGRFKILSLEGRTKKEKWRVTAGRQK
ncbi:RNA-binding protein YlmH [Peribacillus deserti]|uniref:RNA-binding protein YlmH n=1 Tax=Peribacillus deserti TaxID=673318 RepID=A0ABS2QGP6_9BACI|nr:RNA-binding protein [Peribacillus deserti]MBM7692345.1 RNA-binding protein YlmH [Peribacillus deserti]